MKSFFPPLSILFFISSTQREKQTDRTRRASTMSLATGTFGQPLEALTDAQTPVPVLVETILQSLAAVITPDAADLSVLFTVAPSDARVQAFVAQFDAYSAAPASGAPNPLLRLTDPLVAAAILAAFFRMLPEPLVPVRHYALVARCAAVRDPAARARRDEGRAPALPRVHARRARAPLRPLRGLDPPRARRCGCGSARAARRRRRVLPAGRRARGL